MNTLQLQIVLSEHFSYLNTPWSQPVQMSDFLPFLCHQRTREMPWVTWKYLSRLSSYLKEATVKFKARARTCKWHYHNTAMLYRIENTEGRNLTHRIFEHSCRVAEQSGITFIMQCETQATTINVRIQNRNLLSTTLGTQWQFLFLTISSVTCHPGLIYVQSEQHHFRGCYQQE